MSERENVPGVGGSARIRKANVVIDDSMDGVLQGISGKPRRRVVVSRGSLT